MIGQSERAFEVVERCGLSLVARLGEVQGSQALLTHASFPPRKSAVGELGDAGGEARVVEWGEVGVKEVGRTRAQKGGAAHAARGRQAQTIGRVLRAEQ